MTRFVSFGWVVLFCVVPLTSLAEQLDGLDCDKYPQIPIERCAEWKSLNAQGRWWCQWDHDRGEMKAVFGHRSDPVTPGLSLEHITRQSAHSDRATKTLLENYVRQHISRNESVFGFKPHGYELQLIDFQRRPAGVHRLLQTDGTFLEEEIPAVTTIHVQQILRQKGPVDGATIEIQVDDEDRLVRCSPTSSRTSLRVSHPTYCRRLTPFRLPFPKSLRAQYQAEKTS